jgi:uncharacterized protein DUF4286
VSGRANAVYRVTVEVAPEAEAAWAQWMAQEHIPAVLRVGRFLGATRWKDQARSPDGWSRYVLHYRAEGPAAIEAYQRSAETAGLRDDYLARFGKVTRVERTVLGEPIFIGPQG